MIPLIVHLWPGLAGVALVGIWVAQRALGSARVGRLLLAFAGLAWGVALAASALGSVTGRVALWVDSALLHAAAYALGLGCGWLVRRLRAAPAAPHPAAR